MATPATAGLRSPQKSQHSTNKPAKGRNDDGSRDKTEDRISAIKESPTLQMVKTFVQDNSSSISSLGKAVSVSVSSQSFADAIDGFVASANIGVTVLENLAGIHPFIAAPVLAFKLVIVLDLKRRENNAKVLAVKVQMQSMMSVLFQLRNVKDPDDVGPDGLTIHGRLEGLMGDIASYIKQCASACDLYMKKSLIRKYLKSHIYESRLAAYASRFVEYQTQLERALSVHTTIGVIAANEKLDQQGTKLEEIQFQMQELFIRLDTPREREIRDIIETNGGAKASIIDDDVLQTLIDKSGEHLSSSLANQLRADLTEMRQNLLGELSEDVDKALEQNFALFGGKLDLQKREIENSISREGDRIIAFFSGGHERIIDPQIREIWKEMGWKSTVKARHFVLALRDYFLDEPATSHGRESSKSPSNPPSTQLLSPPMTSSPKGASEYDFPESHSQKYMNDDWAKAYVNVSYLQPISEAIDDDGSAFINIKEVNDFTTMRPEGWTVLQWLAYWAAGWHSSISNYRTKIYRLMRKIYRLLQKIRPDNLRMVDAHLDKVAFYRLELLLRATRAAYDGSEYISPELAKLRDEFCSLEEKRIEENMESISYTIDSAATVSLLTGPGRIERYIYPLIYLQLKRHIKTIQLARTHVLHMEELQANYDSLYYIFSAFDTRLQDLSSIFKQMHIKAESQLENFAFGMFKTSYGYSSWSIAGYTFDSVWEDLPIEPEEEDDDIGNLPDIPLTILKYGVQEPFHLPQPEVYTSVLQPDDGPDIMQGSWAGYCLMQDGEVAVPHEGLFRLIFTDPVQENGSVSGKADGYMGSLDVTAVLTATEESKREVDFVMAYNDGYWIRCKGVLDPSAATITGDWHSRSGISYEAMPSPGSDFKTDASQRLSGVFQLSRTPAPLVRFRYTSEAFTENRARARWSFACAAILHGVQQGRLTKDYVVSRLRDGRRFKELAIKRLVERSDYSRRTELTDDERVELRNLESTISPAVDQFYYSIARFVWTRLTYHFGVTCDGCSRRIVQSRSICIVCTDKTLTQSVDFCINCTDKDLPNHETHTSSHSLIRGDHFMHDCQRVWMIPTARAMSDRVKALFRDCARRLASDEKENEKVKDVDVHEGVRSGHNPPMICSYCQKEVSLPCWVCLECAGDLLVCDDCATERLPPLPEDMVATPASTTHVLLRIKDDKLVEIPDEDQLVRVERRLTGVTSDVEERLDNLEAQIMSRTTALEGTLKEHIDGLDKKSEENFGAMQANVEQRLNSLEARFTSLEHMLQEFIHANISAKGIQSA